MVMVLVLNGNNDGDSYDYEEDHAPEGRFTSFAGQRQSCLILISVKFTTRIAIVYCRM